MRSLARRYWTWLGTTLRLTLGGQVIFTVVAVLGLIGVVGDDTTGGVDGPNEAAVLGVWVLLTLLVLVGADAVFRLIRSTSRSF